MRFTGQRQESTLGGSEGLYFYGSRWYDPSLGRWAQPDSLVPNPYDSQSWDRYAYVNNNAVRYIDPSGHKACNGEDENVCTTEIMPDSYGSITRLLKPYGVRLENGKDVKDKWTIRNATATYWGVYDVASKLAGQYVSDDQKAEAFRGVFNTSDDDPLRVVKVDSFIFKGETYTAGGVTRTSHKIEFANIDYFFDHTISRNVVHELGHAYNQSHEVNIQASYVNYRSKILMKGYQFNTSSSAPETFADFMVAWTYSAWNDSIYTPGAREWMTNEMSNP